MAAYEDYISSLFECPICLEPFTDPKSLRCGHQLCALCIRKISSHDINNDVPCPTCREITQYADLDTSVGKLSIVADIEMRLAEIAEKSKAKKKACDSCTESYKVAVTHCKSCCIDLCISCKEKHSAIPALAKHTLTTLENSIYCSIHEDVVVCVFCHDCSVLACYKCVIGKHETHCMKDLDSLAEISRLRIEKYLHDMAKLAVDSGKEQKMRDVKESVKERSEHFEKATAKVSRRSTELIKLLTEALKCDGRRSTAMIEMLSEQITSINDRRSAHQILRGHMETLLATGSDGEIIITAEKLSELPKLSPCEVPDMKEQTDTDELLKTFQEYGAVAEKLTMQLGNFLWSFSSVKEYGTIQLNSRCHGITFGPDNHLFLSTSDALSIKRYSYSQTGDKLSFTMLKDFKIPGLKNKATPIAYDTKRGTLLAACDRQLISIDPENLDESKFNYKTVLTSAWDKISSMTYCEATDQYIIGEEKGSVYMYNPTDDELKKVVTASGDKLSLGSIAVTNHGDKHCIAASFILDGKVQVFDKFGKIHKTYGPRIQGLGKLQKPAGLCYDSWGRLLICDSKNSRLLCLSHERSQVYLDYAHLGGHPHIVVMNPDKELMAVVVGHNTVKLFRTC